MLIILTILQFNNATMTILDMAELVNGLQLLINVIMFQMIILVFLILFLHLLINKIMEIILVKMEDVSKIH
jgi:hypothetical protein